MMDENPYEAPQTQVAEDRTSTARWRMNWRMALVVIVGVVLSIYAMRFEPFNIWRVGILLVVVLLVVTFARNPDGKWRR
jgi:hypothetical protein